MQLAAAWAMGSSTMQETPQVSCATSMHVHMIRTSARMQQSAAGKWTTGRGCLHAGKEVPPKWHCPVALPWSQHHKPDSHAMCTTDSPAIKHRHNSHAAATAMRCPATPTKTRPTR